MVVDVASRYVDAEALTSKDSSKVAKAFEKIYSRKLSFPNTIIVDPGTGHNLPTHMSQTNSDHVPKCGCHLRGLSFCHPHETELPY